MTPRPCTASCGAPCPRSTTASMSSTRHAFSAGALNKRAKELIALAIAVVEGCVGCIASHAQTAAQAGATRQEAAEAIGVTFLMHG